MTRSYDVTSMEVIPQFGSNSDVVVRLNFTYGDTQASLKGSCSLPAPEDTFLPLESISKETALEWLLENCPNTTADFDANLDEKIAAAANAPFVYTWDEGS